LNVVRIDASHANGRCDSREHLLARDEPIVENQEFREDEIHAEQQEYDGINISGKTRKVYYDFGNIKIYMMFPNLITS